MICLGVTTLSSDLQRIEWIQVDLLAVVEAMLDEANILCASFTLADECVFAGVFGQISFKVDA